ncbi:MAG: NAD(P)-dependent oxidoreductase [Culicoidibacterales bacterium]
MQLVSTLALTRAQVQQLKQLGVKVTQATAEELTKCPVDHYEIVVFGQVYEPIDFSRFSNLKVVQLGSMGYDMVPLAELTARQVKVYNNRQAFTVPVAEMVMTYILMFTKQMMQFYNQQRLHQYKSIANLGELTRKRVLVVGTGHIGTEIARKLQVFDCEVIGANRMGLMKHYFDTCIRMDEVDDFLEQIDILILALPATEQTQQWLSQERLELLGHQAIVINIGRGSLVDEQALIAKLENGELAGAALDVFTQEPLPMESRLWDLPNVIITPHNAFASVVNQERTFANVYATVAAYVSGKPLPTVNE